VNVEMTWHHPTLFLIILGWAEFLRRKMNSPMQTPARTTVRSELKPLTSSQWMTARR
jgi:hypothetical protein